MAKYKKLTREDRVSIESALDRRDSFKTIASETGKDCTTISKEVRAHLIFRKDGAYGRAFNDCALRKSCSILDACSKCRYSPDRARRCSGCGRCTSECVLYKKETCRKLLKPPYVCNGCPDRSSCTLEKRVYDVGKAQDEYSTVMKESREGIAVSELEIKRLDSIISPLLLKGQSLHHIYDNHRAELMVSERTLYSYVSDGLFSARNIDMPRVVRMSPRRKKPDTIKIDPKCREGRKREDFIVFMKGHPDTPLVELDSVEGIRGGAVLLTITFVHTGLQLAYWRQANDSQSVTDIFAKLYFELGPVDFMRLFPVCLADNGSEFSDPKKIEFDANGNQRTHVFYCDASAPYQKGSCEVRHEMIRRIIPKHTDISLYSQEQILLMMCHINSYGRGTLGNKSPYEVFAFEYGEAILKKLGLQKISADEIILRPSLLSK